MKVKKSHRKNKKGSSKSSTRGSSSSSSKKNDSNIVFPLQWRRQHLERYLFRGGMLLLLIEIIILLLTSSSSLTSTQGRKTTIRGGQVPPRRRRRRQSDGTFNGYPIYLYDVTKQVSRTKPYSMIHCVGENYQENENWKQRSCQFRFLCYNIDTNQFLVYQRLEDPLLHEWVTTRHPFVDLSETYILPERSLISIGSIDDENNDGTIMKGEGNQMTSNLKHYRQKWFPKIISEPPEQFYVLPDDVIFIPFFSSYEKKLDLRRLIWDDFLSMFTLMHMYQMDGRKVLPLRYTNHVKSSKEEEEEEDRDDNFIYTRCDNTDKLNICKETFSKYWPLMGNNTDTQIISHLDVQFKFLDGNHDNRDKKSNLVCSKDALAGFGPVTDHGTIKVHGSDVIDDEQTQNHGRGGLIWRFRRFMLQKLGIMENEISKGNDHHQSPIKILFVLSSKNDDDDNTNPSKHQKQQLDFTQQLNHLQSKFFGHDYENIVMESVVLDDLSLQEQIKLLLDTSIFISECGEDAVMSIFLPKGASTIFFHATNKKVVESHPPNDDEKEEETENQRRQQQQQPVRMDWDLLNNLSYLYVHWFPIESMNHLNDLQIFENVIVKHINRLKLNV